MKKKHLIIATFTFCLILATTPFLLAADINEPQQSTTGPVPPQSVLDRDKAEIERLKSLTFEQQQQLLTTQHTIPNMPEYFWRHGCGPTAVGMVVGYYDIHGYGDLISGDASTQTAAVNQAIASGGDSANPNPPGSERHYEDYARPEDDWWPFILQDDYIGKRSPHTDNCIADCMNTSKSTYGNKYGWSQDNDIGPSFVDYVNQQNSSYNPSYETYPWSSSTPTLWDVLKNEIDNNRPMVFLVDTDGIGGTDHIVPVIGYDESTPHKYACYTTWSDIPGIRWYTFQGVGILNFWGISLGWSFRLADLEQYEPDQYEPDDTYSEATWIYSGQTAQNHSIYPPADEDWVKFSLSVESEVLIETSNFQDYMWMRLYDSGMNELDYSGITKPSQIDRYCNSYPLGPGLYYVCIGGLGIIANYDLTLSATPCGSGNSAPQLTNGSVNPGTGTTSTNFYWSIDYYDSDGDAPAIKNVYIDGIGHEMSLISGSPSNGTYRFGPLTLSTASHNYYFYFTDGNGGSRRLPPVSAISGPQVSSGGTVYFADSRLKAAVEAKLGVTNPTPADMLNLIWLDARYKNITDLTGMEHATNLTELIVGHNQISSLSPISGLTHLTFLAVFYNEITDISVLSGLTNLTNLNLRDNHVADVSPISSLTNLRILDFGQNPVSNISSLSALTNLTELNFRCTNVSDISFLSGLTNLTILNCEACQISDISSLSGMHKLTELDLSNNLLNTAAYCIYIPLLIANNPGILIDYTSNPPPGPECPVHFLDSNLKAAVELALGISDPLPSDMLALISFDASYRGIVDITGLEHAVNLSSLLLNGNLISDISPLSELSNLTVLSLYGNQINDISILSGLTDLTLLYLNANQISDISSLAEMHNLTSLDLSSNILNTAAYCTYLPLILTNNPGIDLDYDPKHINFLDFAILAEQWLQTSCGTCNGSDLDQDHDVDIDDLAIFSDNWLGGTEINSKVGDFDGDGDVDFADLEVLAEQWLQPPGTPSADIAPRPNGDGIVNFLDFAILAENWLWQSN